jgi:hypothetical protein
VLPKLSGNRAKLERPLLDLCAYLRDLKWPNGELDMDQLDASIEAALPNSYYRALEMLRSLRDFGFVSFFK